MIRPTPRAVLIFALSLPFAMFILLAIPENWIYCLYVPIVVLGFIAADMVLILPQQKLLTHLEGISLLHVGQQGTVSVSLLGEEYTRRVWFESLLEMTGPVVPPRLVGGWMNETRLDLALPLIPYRRGLVEVHALWLRWQGPMGLVVNRRRQLIGASVDVVPDVKGIHQNALQLMQENALFGSKVQQRKGGGNEFDTLCEFSPGMDNRFIDWKRSARHRKLLAKEFRQERNHHIIFAYDTGHLMCEPVHDMPKLDHAIRAGLILTQISLHHGDLVGAASFDSHFTNFIRPNRGMPWFTRIQQFSAALAYESTETNFTLGLSELYTRLQHRSLIVIFTDFVDTISAHLLLESLNLLLRRHVVIFVSMHDPVLGDLAELGPENFDHIAHAVLANNFLKERAVVLERMARMGVHCLDVPAQSISSSLLNQYLKIKQRGLL